MKLIDWIELNPQTAYKAAYPRPGSRAVFVASQDEALHKLADFLVALTLVEGVIVVPKRKDGVR